MDNLQVGMLAYNQVGSLNRFGESSRPKTELEEIKENLHQEELNKPVDLLELSREEKINIAQQKTEMNLCDLTKRGMMALVGLNVGLTLAFLACPTSMLGTSLSAGVGVSLAYVLARTGVDDKLINTVGKGIDIVMTPFTLAARGIKKAFRAVLKKDSNSGGGSDGVGIKPGGKTASEHLASGVGASLEVMKSTPNYMYPGIMNATEAEKALIMDALDGMPLRKIGTANVVAVNPNLAPDMNAAGLATFSAHDQYPIILDTKYANMQGYGQAVMRHEVGHTVDFSESVAQMGGPSHKAPFGKGPHITDYASTNRFEDWAETHEFFHSDNPADVARLKAETPEKYAAMEKHNQPTLMDKVFDRPKIREISKKIAETIDKVPGLRIMLSLAGSILGPLTARSGVSELKKGIRDADTLKKYNGKMNTAKGIAYTSRIFAPVGLGTSVAHMVMNRRLKKGKITPEQAEAFATKLLAAMTGPAGLSMNAAKAGILRTPGGETVREFVYKERKPEGFKEKLGSLIGIGYFDVINPETGNRVSEVSTKLDRSEKAFKRKVEAGSFIGGGIGTVAGFTAGNVIGGTIGGLIAGPPGALTGAFLGKVAGTLYGSYKLAQVGVQVGRLLDKEARTQDVPVLKEKLKDKVDTFIEGMENSAPYMGVMKDPGMIRFLAESDLYGKENGLR